MKTQTYHTPGQWHYYHQCADGSPAAGEDGLTTILGDGGLVAKATVYNARLIAAAPELLAFAKDFEETFSKTESSLKLQPYEVVWLSKARAAIAQAEGRDS